MHFGHANAFRQARALGDELVVGMNMDEEITRIKGPPIMTEEERTVAVRGCKWVDQVVTGVPYTMSPEYLEEVFDKYNIDFVVHGDDPCLLADGTDVYAAAKKKGKYREIKRTEVRVQRRVASLRVAPERAHESHFRPSCNVKLQGVSTTEIVGRMLVMSKTHFKRGIGDGKRSNR
jgi:ethanolamine-phosphate cytidylyltransferase